MTKDEVAAAMDGNEYGSEGSAELFSAMRDSRLICLFGYSDDVVEVRGAEHDEFGTGDLLFTTAGLLRNKCEEDDCPYFADIAKSAARVVVHDGGEEFGMFEFRTAIPHARFNIMEDGELYSSGIVFSLEELS